MGSNGIQVQAIEDKIGILAIKRILFDIAADEQGQPVVDVVVEAADGQTLFSDCNFASFQDALRAIQKSGLKPTA